MREQERMEIETTCPHCEEEITATEVENQDVYAKNIFGEKIFLGAEVVLECPCCEAAWTELR